MDPGYPFLKWGPTCVFRGVMLAQGVRFWDSRMYFRGAMCGSGTAVCTSGAPWGLERLPRAGLSQNPHTASRISYAAAAAPRGVPQSLASCIHSGWPPPEAAMKASP